MTIRDLVYEVYSENDELQSKDDVNKEVMITMMDIATGNWTAIYSEIAEGLLDEESDKGKWINRLERLVGFQRYGVRED